MATLEELVVRIKADSSQLDRALSEMTGKTQQATGKMGGALAKLGDQFRALIPAITVGGIIALTRNAINAGDALNDMSVRTGVAVETLSKLQLFAEQSGTSIEGLAQGLKFMNRNMAEAMAGSASAAEAFTQIGLSVAELATMSPEDQFMRIAQNVSELGSEADKTKALMDIFGRSGLDLAVMMRDGAAGIKAAADEAERLGLVLSSEEAARMDEFNDKWATMTASLQRLAQEGFLAASDAATKFFDILPGPGDKRMQEFFNKDLALAKELGLLDKPEGADKPTAPRRLASSPKKSSSAGEKTLTESQREAARIIDQTRTAYERYDQEVQKASKLLSEHAIDQETFNRYQVEMQEELDSTTKKLAEAGERSEVYAIQVKDYLGDAFESAAFDAESMGGRINTVFNGLIRQIARKAWINPLTDSLSGAISSGLNGSFSQSAISRLIQGGSTSFVGPLPSFDVGTPFVTHDQVAKIHKGERIMTAEENREYSRGGKGSVTYVINAPGADRAALEAVRNEIRQLAGPGVTEGRVANAMKRGGL